MTAARGVVAQVRRTYLSLGTGELAAAAVFVVTAVAVATQEPGTGAYGLWSGAGPLVAILVFAGCYWLLARRWLGSRTIPSWVAPVVRVARTGFAVVLVAGLVGAVVWFPASSPARTVTVAALALGVVEYVNYFVVRLSYPAGVWWREVRRLRTPRLVKDGRAAARLGARSRIV